MKTVKRTSRKQLVNLERLYRNKAFQFTETFFPYTSGQIGPYYVQSAVILKNGEDYFKACLDMSFKIKNCEVISGGETRDWMFSLPVAGRLKKPHSMLYKNGKILGESLKGKLVAHVADLNNEGSSPRDYWIPMIRNAGGKINDIYFYVDRLEDGVKVMKDLNLRRHSIVPLDKTAWDYLKKNKVINKAVYNSLRERTYNKHEWAINMLRSDRGLETLADLLKNPFTKEKGKKILRKGYPKIETELSNRLIEKYGVEILAS